MEDPHVIPRAHASVNLTGGPAARVPGQGHGATRDEGAAAADRSISAVLLAALGLGVLGDALLRVAPWGLNATLWTACLIVAWIWVARASGAAPRGEVRALLAAALALAFAFVLRDSTTLVFWNACALGLTLALAAGTSSSGPLRQAGVGRFIAAPFQGFADAALGAAVLLLAKLRASPDARRRRWGTAAAAARGGLLAFPLLAVFSLLLASADAVFERVLVEAFGDLEELLLHLLVGALVAWPTAGILKRALLDRVAVALPAPGSRPALGAVELGVALGSLDVVFLAFVVVQLRYLFGGDPHVQVTAGLTYAEYARRGFFELVTAAALVLPLLLAADALRPRSSGGHRLFRVLAGAMLALLAVVVISALQRMRLYVAEYGLTELRLVTTAFMLWLVAVFGWFAATVLRGRRERFAFPAYAAGVAVLLALLAVNPAAWVVQVNAARAAETGRFDAWYATALGADAVPVLVRSVPSLPPADRCLAAARLLERWPTPRSVDWRGWNLARSRAWRTVADRRAELRGLACPIVQGRSY